MALTDAQICNLALGRIGQTQFIDDLENDDTGQAQACNAVFEHCKQTVLEAADWGFARKHVSLAQVTDGSGNPITRDGWAYAFAMPTDCQVPRSIFNGIRPGASIPAGVPYRCAPDFSTNYASPPAQPFEVEVSDDGSSLWLLCDLSPAVLVYTKADVGNAVFSQTFVDALAWLIASEVALSLPIKAELSLNAAKRYEAAIAKAKALNLRSRRDDVAPESQFITSRS